MIGRKGNPGLASLVALVSLAGLAVLAAAGATWDGEDGVLLAALVCLVVITELVDFAPFADSRVSLSVAIILAAGTIGGLAGVAIVGSAAVAADYAAHRKPLYKVAFNEGVLVLAGAAYVGVFEAFSTGYRSGDWPAALGPALLGGAANYAINSGLVALAIGLDKGKRPFAVWRDNFRWLLPHYLVLAAVALLMATAYDRWDVAGLALLLFPLPAVWLAIKRYTDHTASPSRTFQRA